MAEGSSNKNPPAGESGKVRGFVRNKIKSQDRPNRGSRARKEWRGCLAKVIKKAASIAELLTEHDQEENLRVIRQAKRATHRVFNLESKTMEEVPDHKTRLAAVVLDLAYREGKPVERQLQISGKFEDLSQLFERVHNSPAASRALEANQTPQHQTESLEHDAKGN